MRKAPLDQFVDDWLMSGNYAPKTQTWYRDSFRTFLAWLREEGCEGILAELSPELVWRWQESLQTRGKAVRTVRGYLATVKSFSRFLARSGYTRDSRGPVNLLETVDIPPAPKTRPDTFSDNELQTILNALNPQHRSAARNRAVIMVMADAGLRIREACGLLIEDIDWQSGRIHVRSATAKGGRERIAHIGRSTLMELKRYLQLDRSQSSPHPELFLDQDGGPLSPHAFQCCLARLKAKLGIKKLHAHKFRRTWATNFRKLGAGDLYDLQREGGWADLQTPMMYYVDTSDTMDARESVMDRWDAKQRKAQRSEQASRNLRREPVQAGQVRSRAK